MHVFAYGTLMCADILSAAAGGIAPPPGEPAVLAGFSRHPVAGEDYPGIRHEAGGRVAGLLYHDLDAHAIARLDRFEGPQYRRETLSVTLADGRHETAEAWVFREDFHRLLEPGEWDFDAFLRERRARFERRYIGFQRG
jgi:gamma-glutamylcyclotransferase (GGCT)/AIG2-like uncharacterized protein YtfP